MGAHREPLGQAAALSKSSKDYWGDATAEAVKAFSEMYSAAGSNKEQQSARIRSYVEHFGVDGPQADFRWMLAAPNCLLDSGGKRPHYPARAVALSQICECEVRAFLRDRKKFHRYYNALLWSQMFLIGKDRQGDHLGILMDKPAAGDDVQDVDWWFARRCMLFFHATGRDDLLDHVPAEKITRQYKEWYDWVRKNRVYMRPDPTDPIWRLDDAAKKAAVYFPDFKTVFLPPPLGFPRGHFPIGAIRCPHQPQRLLYLWPGPVGDGKGSQKLRKPIHRAQLALGVVQVSVTFPLAAVRLRQPLVPWRVAEEPRTQPQTSHKASWGGAIPMRFQFTGYRLDGKRGLLVVLAGASPHLDQSPWCHQPTTLAVRSSKRGCSGRYL